MSNITKNFKQKARRGLGTVQGPKSAGDNIGINVTAGEAVLPVKTVKALGGSRGVHNLIKQTTGKAPKGLRAGGHYAVGGIPLGEVDDLTSQKELSRAAPVAGANSSADASALRTRLASSEGNTIRNSKAQLANMNNPPGADPARFGVSPRPVPTYNQPIPAAEIEAGAARLADAEVARGARPPQPLRMPLAAAAADMLPAAETPGLKTAATEAAEQPGAISRGLSSLKNKAISALGGTPAAAPATTAAAAPAATKNLTAVQQLSAAGDAAVDFAQVGKTLTEAAKTAGSVPATVVNGIRGVAGAVGPYLAPLAAITDIAGDQSATGIAQGAFDVATGMGAKAGGWMLAPADIASRVTNNGRGLVQTMKDRFTGDYVPATAAAGTDQILSALGIDGPDSLAVKGGVPQRRGIAASAVPASAAAPDTPVAPASPAAAAKAAAPAADPALDPAQMLDNPRYAVPSGTGSIRGAGGKAILLDSRPQAPQEQAADPRAGSPEEVLDRAQKLLASRNASDRVIGSGLMRTVYPNLLQAETSRYGHDMAYEGHRLTAGKAQAQLAHEQRKTRAESVGKYIDSQFGPASEKDNPDGFQARRKFERDLTFTLGKSGIEMGDLNAKALAEFQDANEMTERERPTALRKWYMNWVDGNPYRESKDPFRATTRAAGEAGKSKLGFFRDVDGVLRNENAMVDREFMTGSYDADAKRTLDRNSK